MNDHLSNSRAGACEEGGEVSVLLAVERAILHQAHPKGLQGAACVMDRDPGDPADHPVRNDRRDSADKPTILAVLPPARHDVKAILKPGDQHRYICGIILKVTVQRHEDLTAGLLKACSQGCGLTSLMPQADQADPAIPPAHPPKDLTALILRAVIHIEQLESPAFALKDL